VTVNFRVAIPITIRVRPRGALMWCEDAVRLDLDFVYMGNWSILSD
jgi:hypothetical protein